MRILYPVGPVQIDYGDIINGHRHAIRAQGRYLPVAFVYAVRKPAHVAENRKIFGQKNLIRKRLIAYSVKPIKNG
jgi:hypothetical protein